MARLVPNIPDAQEAPLGLRREQQVLELLKARLPKRHRVYHSVHWSAEGHRRLVFGEVDYIVTNAAGDILLIELKTGRMEETKDWIGKRYVQGGRIQEKDAGLQLRNNIDAIKAKFQGMLRGGPQPRIDYLLVCPDHRLTIYSGTILDRSRIVDASGMDRLTETILKLVPTVDEPTELGRKVEPVLAQTLDLAPDVHAFTRESEERFRTLSGTAHEILETLEMTPWRLRVIGGAGCGKSVLAGRRFMAAVEVGRIPLFLCFNRLLAERMRAQLPAVGMINTWYGFCDRFLQDRGQSLDYDRMGQPGFWRRVQDSIVEQTIPEDWLFDTLIIDEGQDFEQDWVDIALLFARPDADVLWLEDPRQNLWGRPAADFGETARITLAANYRTPLSIARYIQEALSLDMDCRSGLDGFGVHDHTLSNGGQGDIESLLVRIQRDLANTGFTNQDILFLSCKGRQSAALSGVDRVGPIRLRQFTGYYDQAGRQIYSEGDIRFETLGRFKGGDAPAVVILDPPDDPTSDRGRTQLYTALTRATARADIVWPAPRRGGA